MLSEALGDEVEVTLIDKSDAFVFGYSKLDVMFGRTTLDAVRLPYRDIAKPGVRFLQETVTAIDPEARRVTTDARRLRGRRPGGRARRRLRLRRHAGARRRRQRVLLRRRRGAAGEVLPTFSRRPRDRRRLRRAVQVPAGAERGRAAAARLPLGARRARRLRDLVRHPVRHAGAAVAGDLARAASPPSRSATSSSSPERRVELARPGAQRRRARRRQRDALRPVPRRPEAPRAGRRDRERDDRGRLCAGESDGRSRRGSPACTRSATSRRSACRRPACSPRAPPASSPSR